MIWKLYYRKMHFGCKIEHTDIVILIEINHDKKKENVTVKMQISLKESAQKQK